MKNTTLKLTKLICLIVLSILNLTVHLRAQANNIEFQHITNEQGLSQSTVHSIIQDPRGFMWFGTEDGLNRYDGNNFKIYRHDPTNPNSISNNEVFELYLDRSGTLWAGTLNGLNQFDYETEVFTRYLHDPDDPHSLSDNIILSICEDHKGNLWVGTEVRGLNKLSSENREKTPAMFNRYQHDPDNSLSIDNDVIFSIYEDRYKNLWIGTMNGLNKYDHEKDTFDHYNLDSNKYELITDPLISDRITSIYEDKTGSLLTGTFYKGLYEFDRTNKRFILLNKDCSLRSICEDHAGNIWIATRANGLFKTDQKKRDFIQYTHNIDNFQSLCTNVLRSVYIDRSNILWVGSHKKGINKVDLEKKGFNHYKYEANNPASIGGNTVSCIFEDHKGILWVGLLDAGITTIDRKKNLYTHYTRDSDPSNGLLYTTHINYIYEDHLRVIWVGTENGGLYKFDREKEQFINIENRQSTLKTMIKSIYEDHLGFLWIGSEEKLHKYNRNNNTFEIFKNDPQNPSSLSNHYVNYIYEDRSETLWMGTDGGGLEKLNRETKQFIHFTYDPSDSNSISNNFIYVIHEDKMGRFWIGTHGGGLNLFDRKQELFTCYKEKDGLPNNVVYGILEDESGNLWLSTNSGLSKFNPETETFKNFNVNDGLQGLEFHEFSFYKSKRTGEMFFGGSNGFNAFFPDSLKENLFTPSIRIVDFQLFNESISVGKNQNERTILKRAITETDEIELTHKDNVFSFEFAALHYSSPENNQYAYMMEGFEKKWNYVNSRHNAAYTNLPAGNYIFRVKGSNNNGIWNEEGTSLRIKISPPFWKTLWFKGMIIFITLGMIYTIHDTRTKSIRKRNVELTEHVEVRTTELKTTMDELMVSNEKLTQTTSQLKTVNNELKDFAYIVSHDLKAPLRGVAQIASWISRDYADVLDEDGKEQLNLLTSRVRRMDGLIDGVLRYSRAGRIADEDKAEIDLNAILKEIIGSLAIPDHIKISVDGELPKVTAAHVQMEQVLQNLISNAIKYMDKPKGKIRIFAEDGGEVWKIGIEDNGPGIDKKYHEKIFQFFQTLESKDTNESTGVGLAVVKKIVERLGGKIWVESKIKKGSTFHFTLPKDESHFKE